MAVLLSVMLAAQADFEAIPQMLLTSALAAGGLGLGTALTMLVVFRERIGVRFTLDGEGVLWERVDPTARASNRIAMAAGLVAGSPGLGARCAFAVQTAVAELIPVGLFVGLAVMVLAFAGGPYWGIVSLEQLEGIDEPALYASLAIWLLAAALGFIWFVAYSLLRDSFGAGQSWGKRLLRLRVIEVDSGAPFGRRASALRNLFGLVSVLLGGAATGLLAFCGLVFGLIVSVEPLAVIISDDRLCIGDRWAGTQVVAD